MSERAGDPPPPDLELGIFLAHEPSGPALRFELRSHAPGRKTEHRSFGTVSLEKAPDRFVRAVFRRAPHWGDSDEEGGTEEARRQLEDLGSYLSHELLPRELGRFLSESTDRSLQVQSDEPWIPWELLLLEGEAGDPGSPDPFLCEAFDLSRWDRTRPQPRTLSLEKIALVAPEDSGVPCLQDEVEAIEELRGAGREVTRIKARPEAVREALASGEFDGFHVIAHGRSPEQADLAEIVLSGGSRFTPVNLCGAARNLGRRRPLVFLNACETGTAGWALTGIGGWAAHFVGFGAGAFLGTHWLVRGEAAVCFARSFYRELLAGSSVARAVRRARRETKTGSDPSWLAYVLHAHPDAVLGGPPEPPYVAPAWPGQRDEGPLSMPVSEWDEEIHPPAALLRAEYQVVPFHGRDRELDDLYRWCLGERELRVRLCTGEAGMGKTRLALELCRLLRNEGWGAGLLREGPHPPEEVWRRLERSGQPLLLVVDYAETRRETLVGLLREALRSSGTKARFFLLARAEGDWWEILKGERDGVGDLLSGPTTVASSLRPLALSREERRRSFEIAARAFSESLGRPAEGSAPADLKAEQYGRVLILHMAALVAALQGVAEEGEDEILESVLRQERRFWRDRLEAHGLPTTFDRGLERAMAAITLVDGAQSQADALEVFEGLRIFEGRPRDLLVEAAHLLHGFYPLAEDLWIAPIRPSLLGEHLVLQASRDAKDREELENLAFGSKGPPS